METGKSILYFDGVCNLCNGVVQFFIKRDKKRNLLFASLQSAAGQKAIREAAQQGVIADSVLFYIDGRYYAKSTAVIHTLKLLGGFWKLSVIGFIAPRLIRNSIYDLVARNRYRWFGKKEACMIPTKEMRSRFLE